MSVFKDFYVVLGKAPCSRTRLQVIFWDKVSFERSIKERKTEELKAAGPITPRNRRRMEERRKGESLI